MESLSQDVSLLSQYVLWFVFCFAVFSLLAEMVPNIKGQKVFRKGIATDLVYWFLMPLFYVRLSQWLLVGVLMLFYGDAISGQKFGQYGFGLFAGLPIVLQLLISLFLTDCIQYWTHRLFHDRVLWKFHAVHHMPTELDWLSGVRFHPVNLAVHSTFVGLFVYLLGFSPQVFVLLVPFNILYSALVHANLHWTFGPMKYVFASPVFHRWHHTSPEEGGEKNFAPTFAFLDVLFGTFYMPQNALPAKFGVSDAIPESFWGQMAYPFRPTKSV